MCRPPGRLTQRRPDTSGFRLGARPATSDRNTAKDVTDIAGHQRQCQGVGLLPATAVKSLFSCSLARQHQRAIRPRSDSGGSSTCRRPALAVNPGSPLDPRWHRDISDLMSSFMSSMRRLHASCWLSVLDAVPSLYDKYLHSCRRPCFLLLPFSLHSPSPYHRPLVTLCFSVSQAGLLPSLFSPSFFDYYNLASQADHVDRESFLSPIAVNGVHSLYLFIFDTPLVLLSCPSLWLSPIDIFQYALHQASMCLGAVECGSVCLAFS